LFYKNQPKPVLVKDPFAYNFYLVFKDRIAFKFQKRYWFAPKKEPRSKRGFRWEKDYMKSRFLVNN